MSGTERQPEIGPLALRLFDATFAGPTWRAWRAFVVALFGLEPTATEAETILAATGRSTVPTERAAEVWAICGRRGGKSRVSAFLAVVFATLPKHRLAPGERAIVQVLASDRRQARVIFNYARALLREHAMLADLVQRETASEIYLTNGVNVEIATASSRAVRGVTVIAAICDEISFWPQDESADPDTEVLAAIRPAMATVDGILIAISTPYGRTGELYRAFERHHGRDDTDTLIWKAPTRAMNPSVDQSIIDRAMVDDPSAAAAEWGAEFRSDLENVFAREAIAAVVPSGCRERAPVPGTAYVAFVDPSGGSHDSMTLSVAHRSIEGCAILDLIREVKAPFNPEDVVAEFAQDLARYGVGRVTADNYAAAWPRAAFQKHKIDVDTSELTRSQLYLELLPLVNARGVALLDDDRLIGQLTGLQRRVGRSGKDSIDHRAGKFDDLSNSTAGALVFAARGTGRLEYPPTFTSCLIFDYAKQAPRCALFGGWHTPSDPHCFKHCTGLRTAWPAYQASRGGLSFPDFIHQHFKLSAAASDFAWHHWQGRAALANLGL